MVIMNADYGVLKDRGNSAYRNSEYASANELYGRALIAARTNIEKATVYSNISQCNIKLSNWRLAKQNASDGLSMLTDDIPLAGKLLFRRGLANKELGDYQGALSDFQKSLSITDDKATRLALIGLERAIARESAAADDTHESSRSIPVHEVPSIPPLDEIDLYFATLTSQAENSASGQRRSAGYGSPVSRGLPPLASKMEATPDLTIDRAYTTPVTSAEIPHRKKSAVASTTNVHSAHNDTSISSLAGTTLSPYVLHSLSRISGKQRSHALIFIFDNLPSSLNGLQKLFHIGGIESETLDMVLESINHVLSLDIENAKKKATELMTNLPKVTRFKLALMFASEEYINKALSLVGADSIVSAMWR
ncbi:hypothetical protein CANCADRAFT_43140 [Tortispora caseinolytica NRRL Y-17796]|uniref:RNA polymerase II-associated protein 3 n=1 Tax=Tortispora caseinolytica NRRL Y-17796 TaxID=767744 RepID=A0A1E4TLL4_9ASCO|nr:hypothetical protein CANCADRAFT_43140 [Tortispora caseinolytica NRRL Y-17796]